MKSGTSQGRRGGARALAEKVLAAERAGNTSLPDELFDEASRIDPAEVAEVLTERADTATPGSLRHADPPGPPEPGAARIRPHAAAPSRAGISGDGSGADTQGTGAGGPASKV